MKLPGGGGEPREELEIGSVDRRLSCSLWRQDSAGAALIVAPAMGVTRSFYAPFCSHFAGLGYGVLSFDYFGMRHRKGGYSSPVRLGDWGYLDLRQVIDRAGELFPGSHLVLAGHSIAGQVLPLAPNRNGLRAAFLVASQNVSQYHWSGLGLVAVRLFWYVVLPFSVAALGYLPPFAYGGRYPLHRDIALDWRDWGRRREGLLGAIPAARTDYASVEFPVKFLSLEGDDLLAPRRAVETLAASYGSRVKEHHHLTCEEAGLRVGHFDFFRPRYASLWPLAEEWFREAIDAAAIAER